MRTILSIAFVFVTMTIAAVLSAQGQDKKDEVKKVKTDVATPLKWPGGNLFYSDHMVVARGTDTTIWTLFREEEEGEWQFKLIVPPAVEKSYEAKFMALDKKLLPAQGKLADAESKLEKGGLTPVQTKMLEAAKTKLEKEIELYGKQRMVLENAKKAETQRLQAGVIDTKEGVVYYALKTEYIQSGFKPERLAPGVSIKEVRLILNPGIVSQGDESKNDPREEIILLPDERGDYNPPSNAVTPEKWNKTKGDHIIVVALEVPGTKRK